MEKEIEKLDAIESSLDVGDIFWYGNVKLQIIEVDKDRGLSWRMVDNYFIDVANRAVKCDHAEDIYKCLELDKDRMDSEKKLSEFYDLESSDEYLLAQKSRPATYWVRRKAIHLIIGEILDDRVTYKDNLLKILETKKPEVCDLIENINVIYSSISIKPIILDYPESKFRYAIGVYTVYDK